MDTGNRLVLSATLIELEPLRHTPAGIPILRFQVAHTSDQVEGGTPRKVDLSMNCIAVQTQARILAAIPLGTRLGLSGFVAPRSRGSKQITFHVDAIDFERT